MGTIQRRERERQEIRARILDAARRLFATEGYDAVSMRKIAEAIEYSPTAIYVHFRDKESLVEELCRCDFAALSEGFSRLAGIVDPVERIRALGRAYVMFAVEHPQHFRFMFMTPMSAKPSGKALEDRGNPDKDAYAMLRESVRAAIAAGRFAPGFKDADFLAQVLWSSVHGLAALRVAKSQNDWVQWRPLERLLDVVPDSALRGLLAEGDPMLAKLAPMADRADAPGISPPLAPRWQSGPGPNAPADAVVDSRAASTPASARKTTRAKHAAARRANSRRKEARQ